MPPLATTHNFLNRVQLDGYSLAEPIYHSDRTVVYRGLRTGDQVKVVIKILGAEYPSFSELVRFRNQYLITQKLTARGIVKPLSLESCQNGYALVMLDDGSISLRDWLHTDLSDHEVKHRVAEILDIALQLADILHNLHQERIVHQDIKPDNILIHPVTKQVQLIDFSIASQLSKETLEIQHPLCLEGTLAYMAPEQTGRMNRGIDYRADFYALGVTLYQLLTGKLPFDSNDLLELIHSHIAKSPTPPHQYQSIIPPPVSAIVLKLMAKNAEDRYQSALGLKHDLQRCVEEWRDRGTITPFPLAQRDRVDRFLISERLYGREVEVKQLLDTFTRVSQGQTELMLIAGAAGVGKTAVINEVHKPIARQRGYFIKGKFDQFNRNIPLSAFVQAFQDLVQQLLAESDVQLQEWRTQILDAVGDNGQVLIEVIPELERIIGAQPQVSELSGIAAQHRFSLVIQNFMRVLATSAHPLTLFIDDLQWADGASLKLLPTLMQDISHLLILGAYRDQEVPGGHPLRLMLKELQTVGASVNTIKLCPLQLSDLDRLVADTLVCERVIAQPLSKLIYRKTKGNPFFTTQFLKALYQDGLIEFNPSEGGWQCDLAQIEVESISDDVVEFMTQQLQKLPHQTQDFLKLAACIGAHFDLYTLALVSTRSLLEVGTALGYAVREGSIVSVDRLYKFFPENTPEEPGVNWEREEIGNCSYRFLHDRVQQAAYHLIPPDQSIALHLQIGRLLWARIPRQEQELHLFAIVNQLNRGISLIDAPQERKDLAALNLKVGEKARLSAAYDAAMNYLNTGLELLTPNAWQQQYGLCLALHQLTAEVAYLAADYERMDTLLAIGLSQAKHDLDRVPFYETQILALVAQNRVIDAVKYARQVLAKFGVRLPQQPSSWRKIRGFLMTFIRMAGQTPQDLLALPVMTNPHKLAACRLLNATGAAAAGKMPEMLPFITFNGLALYLRYGNIPKSAMGYIIYAFLLCEKLGQVERGCAIGRAAIALSHQTGKTALAPTLFLWNYFLAYRQESLVASLPYFLEAYQVGLEVGDLEYASYSLTLYFIQSYWLGQNLTELLQAASASRVSLERLQHQAMMATYDLNCQIIENLLLGKKDVCQLVGRFFDETHPDHQNLEFQVQISYRKLELAYLCGQMDLAAEQLKLIERNQHVLEGAYIRTILYFYGALVRLAQYPLQTRAQQKRSLTQATKMRRKLTKLAQSAPMNYQHQILLVEAELWRVRGRESQAGAYYDQAIAAAQVNNYPQAVGLANELAAKFYLTHDRVTMASVYMQAAYYSYAKWGAKAKTDDLIDRYPQLLRPILQQPKPSINLLETLFSISSPQLSLPPTEPNRSSHPPLHQQIDFAAILTASQSLTSKIELNDLLHQLTQIILQNSGSDRCALLLPHHDEFWKLEALATPERAELVSCNLADYPHLPVKLIHYVKNTQKIVVIDNLQTDLPIIDDYLTHHHPKSLLCLPLLNQGQINGILYLENRLTSGVFSRDRLLILNFLCTQAAISLENARLFREHQQTEAQLQQTNTELLHATRLKDQFLATMSHELRTPLNAILGMTESLQEEIFGDLTERQQKALNMIERNGLHLLELINDILDLSKIAAGQIELNYTKTAIAPLCHRSLESILVQATQKALQVESQIPLDLPDVYLDERRICQVLINLLNNAVKFTPTGGQIALTASIDRTHDRLCLTVRDTGIGIAPEDRQRIFEAFIQIDSNLNRQYEGTGLGLAIIKRIIELHQGDIHLTSELGLGSVFTISLPLNSQLT